MDKTMKCIVKYKNGEKEIFHDVTAIEIFKWSDSTMEIQIVYGHKCPEQYVTKDKDKIKSIKLKNERRKNEHYRTD